MIARAAAGALLAGVIALAAWRAGALARSGALAAAAVGTVAIAAGWSWGIVLIAFFVTSSALSRWRGAVKAARVSAIVEKGGARDAVQVVANGGVFAAAALGWLALPGAGWMAAGAGALAAAAADTWSTEIGTLAGRDPRHITTGRRVPAGSSGAVSAAGLLAMLAGALFIAGVTLAVGWPARVAAAAAAGGVAGALADSLAGALWQDRRRCPRCDAATERAVHGCGTRTEHAGGVAWLDNDGVNLLAGIVGAAVALLAAR